MVHALLLRQIALSYATMVVFQQTVTARHLHGSVHLILLFDVLMDPASLPSFIVRSNLNVPPFPLFDVPMVDASYRRMFAYQDPIIPHLVRLH